MSDLHPDPTSSSSASAGVVSPYFNTEEAAAFLRVSKSGLAHQRMLGEGPIYSIVGRRTVIYRREDLEAYVAANAEKVRLQHLARSRWTPGLDRDTAPPPVRRHRARQTTRAASSDE